ncbi:MAG: succinate dehydrogenase cytochrome b subunit [Candidatus Marinimicrobia bacterium]|nr:succinate dehydrogenase cytochrome b subunit [Candidatus Neomarinimicrobiota bacterium]MCH7762775.1 succinate dehydrogenase cytochrome b subunit [Candidatus Neomarinimicrobiota bacterium]
MSLLKSVFISSIGKKILMATTGLLLCLFLVIHLIGNLILFAGPDAFNLYVETLSSVKPIVRSIEIILALIFLNHIFLGSKLTFENRNATTQKYVVNSAGENSSFFSRNMFISGSILFIFLMTHLSTFWYLFQKQHDEGNFYEIVMGNTVGFGNPIITALYCIAMILLGFHLRHGFQSAFQTFGIRYNKYSGLIETVAILFWLIIPLGFLSIAVWFGIFGGGY